jgi:putative heme-binding domain-containing protein
LRSPQALDGLKRLTKQAAADPAIRVAWLSSVHQKAAILALEMLPGNDDTALPLLLELIRQVAAQRNDQATIALLQGGILKESHRKPRQARLLEALGEGLRRRGQSLSGLLDEKAANDELRNQMRKLFTEAAEEVQGTDHGLGGRDVGVRLLAFADEDTALAVLPELFSPQTSPELQQAAVKSLAAHAPERVAEALLANWRSFAPALRRDVVDVLVQSETGASQLLVAVSSGEIKLGEIERDKKQLLLKHPQEKVRDAAKNVLGAVAENRKKVVEDYQAALSLAADAGRGRQVYAKTCAGCHRAGTEGFAVGPDLISTQNKSPDDLLIALLDPNREAQPAYINYSAQTVDGKVFAGIIASENAASVTLKRAEAKEDVIQRENLDVLASSGQSLMPEGLEKDLSPQQVADVLAFIKSLPPPAK